jgi:hypothetical protein
MTTRRVAGCVYFEPDVAPKFTWNAHLGSLMEEIRDAVRERGEGAILTVCIDAQATGVYSKELITLAFNIAVNTFCMSKKEGDND